MTKEQRIARRLEMNRQNAKNTRRRNKEKYERNVAMVKKLERAIDTRHVEMEKERSAVEKELKDLQERVRVLEAAQEAKRQSDAVEALVEAIREEAKEPQADCVAAHEKIVCAQQ